MRSPGLLLWSDLSIKEFLELVELADSVGYSEFWYTDIRFLRDCYVGLTLAARHSRHMLLGPGVSDPYSRHPAMIAMAIASLDEVSSGRAQVGLGTGVASSLAQMHIVQDKPVRALREAIELLRAMLGGEVVNFKGELFHLDRGRLGFTPVRATIPIFVATHSPQILRLSGRMADGILLANMGRRQAIERATKILREAERSNGRPEGSVAVHLRLETCVSDDEERALDVARSRFAVRLVDTYPSWDYLTELGVEPAPKMRDAAESGDASRVAKYLSDDDVRASILVGSVPSVIGQLKAMLTPEVTKVTIRPLAFPGQGLDVTVSRFMKEVWPAVEAALGQNGAEK